VASKYTQEQYDDGEYHDQRFGLIYHLRNIAWSCWYVLEDLWKLIAPSIILFLKAVWKVLKPAIGWLWRWFKRFVNRHPAGSWSALLHVILVILLAGGLPSCSPKDKIKPPTVVMVELLPVAEKANIKPVIKEPAPVKKAKPKAKPKSPVKKISGKPKPPKKPVERKVVSKPKPKPKAVSKKSKVKPVSKPKPKPKPKANPAKTPENKPAPAVLNKLAKPEKPKPKPKPVSLAEYDPTKPLAQSVLSSIQSQLASSWRVLPGARDVGKTLVTISFKLSKWGTASDIKVVDAKNDPVFKAAADNAIRAVQKASPLKGLPIKQHEQWKELVIDFDPAEMY
jgi:outer membrane biosynthesis protein TonB